jgi:hypothetical protein
LEYANAVGLWSPYRQKYIEALEKVQMRATKITINNKELSYPERLKIKDSRYSYIGMYNAPRRYDRGI